jgi:hypothetical protein
LVILFLLIIDPPTWAVGEQDRHFRNNIPDKDRSADHASAILTVANTRTLDRVDAWDECHRCRQPRLRSTHPTVSEQRRHLPHFQRPEKYRALGEAQREGTGGRTISRPGFP